MGDRPFFSIITCTFNSERFIEKNINSVLSQNFSDYEHLVIDGLSTDKTISILQKKFHSRLYVYSEADLGIYDAMNKGIERAKGKYLIFLNSDDAFSNFQVLHYVNEQLQLGFNVFFGSVHFLDSLGNVARDWIVHPGIAKKNKFYVPPHPGFFVELDLLNKYNLRYNLAYRICSDMDLMLTVRVLPDSNCFYSEKVITNMEYGGISTQKRTLLRRIYEVFYIYMRHSSSFTFSFQLILDRYIKRITKN
jgi:glycosyltransferase involved in cell wall biosynthesis